jgi:hypothetical protein
LRQVPARASTAALASEAALRAHMCMYVHAHARLADVQPEAPGTQARGRSDQDAPRGVVGTAKGGAVTIRPLCG